MKRVVFSTVAMLGLAALTLALTPTTARADSIDFNFLNGAAGSWSWNGGSGAVIGNLVAPPGTLQVSRTGGAPVSPASFAGTLAWTTGAFSGGTGTILNPFVFGTGGSVSVTNSAAFTIGSTTIAASTTLFSGTFTGASIILNGASSAIFAGNFVIGTINPTLLTALNFSSTPTGATGVLSANLNGTLSAGQTNTGSISSGDLTLTVPEPGTLMLFGTGLLGIGGLLRRKFAA